jgi:hypothetical protein
MKEDLLENVLKALLASGVAQSELVRATQMVLSDSVSNQLHAVVLSLMDEENKEV